MFGVPVHVVPAPAVEPVKEEQGKSSTASPKAVQNGNHGLTADEIMQKKREEFFRKRMGVPVEKPRSGQPDRYIAKIVFPIYRLLNIGHVNIDP